MSILKATLVIGLIAASATQGSFAAQKSDRSYDQEVVVLTDRVQNAQDTGRITPRQALEIKNKEEKIVTRADDLRDDNRGEIKAKDAAQMRSKLFSLDDQLSRYKLPKKYR